uniref:Lipocalin n=1 Tax=Elaeophora elaphi TaxID=1147741 RepID=A0A158Q753_9BILA
MWFTLFSLIYLLITEQTTGKLLNKKVSVPDNDYTLQQILYRSGTLYANSKLPNSESNWWIPVPGEPLKATVIRTYNKETKKYYATYSFFQTNARSLCSKNVRINRIFAWTENVWETTEIEGACDIKSIRGNQIKDRKALS